MSETPFSSPLEETVVIVGVGMIGGSIAAALKQRNLVRQLIGVGRDPRRIEAARSAGLIDEAVTDLSSVVSRADIIVFCTPVEHVANDVQTAEMFLRTTDGGTFGQVAKRPLMTDVGSVKRPICDRLSSIPAFVGSHPIAGSHRQGFEAANPRLFENRVCIVTPMPDAPAESVARLERFWGAIGMKTVRMSPDIHDSALAMTSHLPHVIASSLAATLAEENVFFTGSGFRDTTRIAAGDPDLWTGILLNNCEHVVRGVDEMQSRLAQFRQALARRDAGEIRHLLEIGQESRKRLDGPTNSST